MKYNDFPDDRSELFYNICEKHFRPRDPIEVKNHIAGVKNGTSKYFNISLSNLKSKDMIALNNGDYFDFKLYIKKKYTSTSSNEEIKILICKSRKNICQFLDELYVLLSTTGQVYDSSGHPYLDFKETGFYRIFYMESEVQDFVYALSKSALFYYCCHSSFLSSALEGIYEGRKLFFDLNDRLKEKFSFLLSQYLAILEYTLSDLSSNNLGQYQSEHIEEMVKNGLLDNDGKTVIGKLDNVITYLNTKIELNSSYIHRTFIQGSGKNAGEAWSKKYIQECISKLT